MKRSTTGFTIVELLIVIVVIGILAAITIVAFSGIQSRSRDSERRADMGQLHKALEMFHVENGYYPPINDMLSASFRTNQLKIPADTARPPGKTHAIYSGWSNSPDMYGYVGEPMPGGTTLCSNHGEKCAGYLLTYRLESDPTTRINRYSLNR